MNVAKKNITKKTKKVVKQQEQKFGFDINLDEEQPEIPFKESTNEYFEGFKIIQTVHTEVQRNQPPPEPKPQVEDLQLIQKNQKQTVQPEVQAKEEEIERKDNEEFPKKVNEEDVDNKIKFEEQRENKQKQGFISQDKTKVIDDKVVDIPLKEQKDMSKKIENSEGQNIEEELNAMLGSTKIEKKKKKEGSKPSKKTTAKSKTIKTTTKSLVFQTEMEELSQQTPIFSTHDENMTNQNSNILQNLGQKLNKSSDENNSGEQKMINYYKEDDIREYIQEEYENTHEIASKEQKIEEKTQNFQQIKQQYSSPLIQIKQSQILTPIVETKVLQTGKVSTQDNYIDINNQIVQFEKEKREETEQKSSLHFSTISTKKGKKSKKKDHKPKKTGTQNSTLIFQNQIGEEFQEPQPTIEIKDEKTIQQQNSEKLNVFSNKQEKEEKSNIEEILSKNEPEYKQQSIPEVQIVQDDSIEKNIQEPVLESDEYVNSEISNKEHQSELQQSYIQQIKKEGEEKTNPLIHLIEENQIQSLNLAPNKKKGKKQTKKTQKKQTKQQNIFQMTAEDSLQSEIKNETMILSEQVQKKQEIMNNKPVAAQEQQNRDVLSGEIKDPIIYPKNNLQNQYQNTSKQKPLKTKDQQIVENVESKNDHSTTEVEQSKKVETKIQAPPIVETQKQTLNEELQIQSLHLTITAKEKKETKKGGKNKAKSKLKEREKEIKVFNIGFSKVEFNEEDQIKNDKSTIEKNNSELPKQIKINNEEQEKKYIDKKADLEGDPPKDKIEEKQQIKQEKDNKEETTYQNKQIQMINHKEILTDQTEERINNIQEPIKKIDEEKHQHIEKNLMKEQNIFELNLPSEISKQTKMQKKNKKKVIDKNKSEKNPKSKEIVNDIFLEVDEKLKVKQQIQQISPVISISSTMQENQCKTKEDINLIQQQQQSRSREKSPKAILEEESTIILEQIRKNVPDSAIIAFEKFQQHEEPLKEKQKIDRPEKSKIITELVEMVSFQAGKEVRIIKERLNMLEEDVRSRLYRKQLYNSGESNLGRNEKMRAYSGIIQENISLKDEYRLKQVE